MSDFDRLSEVLGEVAAGKRVPYLGPEISALSGGDAPVTNAEFCARIEAEVRPPKRAAGNLWAVAQYVESRKFRATLNDIVNRAFAGEKGSNPVHEWLAKVAPPMVVDTWYDDGLTAAFPEGGDWSLIQGVSRNGEWIDIFTKAYDSRGNEVTEAEAVKASTLLYKPLGIARSDRSFLLSDSDFVEVLTEIDIQRPIPQEVQERRSGRPFLFVGCRFDDQMLRSFARQIAKRSATGHVAVLEGPLTRMEQRFLDNEGIERLDLPASAVAEALALQAQPEEVSDA